MAASNGPTASDRAVVARWRGKLAARRWLLRRAEQVNNKVLIAKRIKQIHEAERVIKRHSSPVSRVSAPVDPIQGHSWGWHPGVHDGVDVIANYNDDVVAMVKAKVVDSRSSGWWGKGAQPSSGHPISDGDGIIQLQSLVDVGSGASGIRKGDVLGYGHTEHSVVKVGQTVVAGQNIGRIGWANAAHIHLMMNHGDKRRPDGGFSGVGTFDPEPFLVYVINHA